MGVVAGVERLLVAWIAGQHGRRSRGTRWPGPGSCGIFRLFDSAAPCSYSVVTLDATSPCHWTARLDAEQVVAVRRAVAQRALAPARFEGGVGRDDVRRDAQLLPASLGIAGGSRRGTAAAVPCRCRCPLRRAFDGTGAVAPPVRWRPGGRAAPRHRPTVPRPESSCRHPVGDKRGHVGLDLAVRVEKPPVAPPPLNAAGRAGRAAVMFEAVAAVAWVVRRREREIRAVHRSGSHRAARAA
jgi:hypothetical protein